MKIAKSIMITIFLISYNQAYSAVLPATERQALIKLYNETKGDTWGNKSGWRTGPLYNDGFAMPGSENTWYGVTTDANNMTVQAIILPNNKLWGSIPHELGNLENLQQLDLHDNYLTGEIPLELGNLRNLQRLDISLNTLLMNNIPPELGNLHNLRQLDLSYTQIMGIPPELGNLHNLRQLDLSHTQISSIPPEFGNLHNLELLDLSNSGLTGTIPASLGNLSNLSVLYLQKNSLTGDMPDSLVNLNNLQELRISSNQFTGHIPSNIGNLSNLVWLDLSNNRLSGGIPSSLGDLSNLQQLNLSLNYLAGSIPSSLGKLSSLFILNLASNQIAGNIPTSLANLTKLYVHSWETDIRYNALYVLDSDLITFLNSKFPKWAETQTIAPKNVSANPSGLTSVTVSWEPIPYKGDNGGYRIFISTASGGPYTFCAQTSNKSVSSQQVSGLNPGSIYYFVVHTRTNPHNLNKNILDSENSDEAKVMTPLAASEINIKQGTNSIASSGTYDFSKKTINTFSDVVFTIENTGNDNLTISTLPLIISGPDASQFSITVQPVSTIAPAGSTTFILRFQPTTIGTKAAHIWIWNSDMDENPYLINLTGTGAITSELTTISPNGGESWLVGSSHNIVWTSPGTISNVKIEYSINSGTDWTSIVASVLNTGSFAWTIPNTPSTTCLVRISEATTGTSADMSDAVFSIVSSVAISGTVTSGGVGLSNVVMTGLTENPVTDASGQYSGNVPSGWTGTITPTKTGYAFSPASRTYSNITSNQVAQDYTATSAFSPAERQVLIELYNSANGDAWIVNTGWKTPPLHSDGFAMPGTENTWYGVTTDAGNSSVQQLILTSNNLTGTIPASLGNLSHLQTLSLSRNQLTGSIPDELGNLSNLGILYLYSNQLTGGIPASLGNLTKLKELWLSSNKLAGTIPPSLGNLVNLQELWISSNQLFGNIPVSIANLNQLSSSGTSIGYNALHTSDPMLLAFLNAKDSDWAETQTIAPTNLSVIPPSSSLVYISWTPISYLNDTGGYRIYYATVSGGPYTFYAQTDNKSSSSAVLSGFTPGTTYYFVVQTRTDSHPMNQNAVDSEYSPEVSASILIVPSTITVTSPNGGESWQAGTFKNITWATTGTVSNVRIEYSNNGGMNYMIIVASTANTGNYSWTIPNTPSAGCRVRISEVFFGVPSDVSDAVFSIVDQSPPRIALSRYMLNYGHQRGGASTPTQSLTISNAGGGALKWTATSQSTWMAINPVAGTNTSKIDIRLDPRGLSPGAYVGAVIVNAPGAVNSPQTVTVNLEVLDGTSAPIGMMDTPLDGTVGIEGSIPVTGWVVDDIEAVLVGIFRDPVNGEGANLEDYIYIGDAVFVEGARPDVEQAYPTYPLNYRAGWGYMMLTNFLPNGGNGTFRIHAIATDMEGNSTLLGSRTITCDNAYAILPFGAIDIPSQGGTASGSGYINYAWVLATGRKCIPTDGSSIWAWVDGLPIGHPSYGYYRVDIATLFPGYCNASGAIGYIAIDTTKYTNGVHTIVWSATDSAGVNNGFGSRYFTIQNAGSSVQTERLEFDRLEPERRLREAEADSLSFNPRFPVFIRKGFDRNALPEAAYPDIDGRLRVEIRELERVEIDFNGKGEGTVWKGYLKVGDELRALPIGTTFDASTGILYWQPGPGFIGDYEFVFQSRIANNAPIRKSVTVTIKPKE